MHMEGKKDKDNFVLYYLIICDIITNIIDPNLQVLMYVALR